MALDALVPGLAVRVTDKGTRTYVLTTRYPGSSNPTRRALGEVGELGLAEARQKAREWLKQIAMGLDPTAEARRERAAEQERRASTFALAAEEYITSRLISQRKGARAAREIRKELIPHWGSRPLADIKRVDVVRVVDAVAKRGPYYARNVYQHAQGLFNWAAKQGIYGLELSPCDGLRPRDLISQPLAPRQRVLAEPEIRALWTGAERLGYPSGPLTQLLMLTGARLSEVAGARWQEFDIERGLWTVPAQRFKSDATHLVPLTDVAVALLQSLPQWGQGDALFSTTGGVKPVNGFSKAKDRLDKLITAELGAPPPSWVFHDIRRTVRTQLSRLRVPTEVAELVIGHGKKGLARVYDQHEYLDEMREALEAWAARLQTIIATPPSN
jgi:integrase